MATKTQIFITGATGYVAGSAVDRLLRHPAFVASDVTALVRKADKTPAFESLGVKTVLGSYDDHALLERQANQSDIVFACADSDNANACAAILKGLEKRHEATKRVPVLIHTSGTAIVVEDTKGEYTTGTIWDDTDVKKLDTILDTQLHRNVDALIHAADEAGYVKAYFVVPSTIYGFASGKLVDLGVQNKRSIQIPLMVAACVARKRAGYVGKGLNVWPNVHVDDVADLFVVLYDAIVQGKAPGHGHEGYYFAENGHHVMKDVSVKIGESLYALGGSETPTPNAFTEQDYKRFPAVRVKRYAAYILVTNNQLPLLGTDCMCKATRARALGWKPKHTIEDMFESLGGEVEWEMKHAAK